MAVITPVVPDIQKGIIVYLQGLTDAGDKVMDIPHRSSKAPFIIVTWEGIIQQSDTRVPRARITIDVFAQSPSHAKYIARQVREALVPPENVTYGVHAEVQYTDYEEEVPRTIVLSGATVESGPREGPEQRERIITTYLVDYYGR